MVRSPSRCSHKRFAGMHPGSSAMRGSKKKAAADYSVAAFFVEVCLEGEHQSDQEVTQ